jgi:hypothetical protein
MLFEWDSWSKRREISPPGKLLSQHDAILSGDAGQSFVGLDDVKPLLDVCKLVAVSSEFSNHDRFGDEKCEICVCDSCKALKAVKAWNAKHPDGSI